MITQTRKKAAAALVLTIALYAIVGFYLLPVFLKEKLPTLVAEQTGIQAQLKRVTLNPFSFELELEGFLLGPVNKSLFGFDALSIDINAFESLIKRDIVFDSIVLRKPAVNIWRQSDGSFNFNAILPKHVQPPEDKKTTTSPSFLIHHLAVEQGKISWQDSTTAQQKNETVQALNLSVADLSTQNATAATFDLGLGLTSGGHLKCRGELTLKPFTSKGGISLEKIDLSRVWSLFLQQMLPVEITGGSLNLQSDFQASATTEDWAVVVSKGMIDLTNLVIAEMGQEGTLLTIPSFMLNGIAVDLNKHQVAAASLSSKDASIKASLLQDGRLNYQAIFSKSDSTKESEPATASPPALTNAATQAWKISLGKLALKNYQMLFTDQSRQVPQTMQLSGINVNLQNIGNPGNEKLPAEFTAVFNEVGQLKIDGDVSLSPLAATLTVDVKGVKLKNFQNYLDDFLNLELVDGEFNTHGHLQLTNDENLQVAYQGDASLDDLITRDKLSNKDFLKWSGLELNQIDVDLAKQTLKIGKVSFDNPYVRFSIQKDRSTNFADILLSKPAKQNGAKQSAEVKVEKTGTSPIIDIGKIEFKDGYSDFADYSLILPFVADMNALNGEVDGFSSEQDAAVKLSLQGRVYDLAQVTIKGSYQIKSGDSDITLKYSHMPLPLITPYMADFAGYKIEKGQMALDLQYKINQGQLAAQNKIFIDQLILGEQVENPHASSLPLHLAIALLKDADGKINLDFPVTGSLDDPQFSIGSLIADVLGNLINKLVMSPFQALGDLFGDDEDYSAINFLPGSAELKSEETAKLDQLSLALQNRPGLTLEIKGMAYQSQDWPVLRFDALIEVLKKMKSGELRDKGEKIRSEYIELSDNEYKRLLEKFYKEVFPQEIEYSPLGAPRVKTQPDEEFYKTARQKLEAVMQPEPQRLNDLAIARANAISKYLVEKSHLDIDRVYILAPELDPADAEGIVSILSLNVQHL